MSRKLKTFDVAYTIKGTFVERVYDSTSEAEAMAMAIDRLNYNPIRITEGRDIQVVEISEINDE